MAAFATAKPKGRLVLTRPLKKRAGARTSQREKQYSSMECSPWAQIRRRKRRLVVVSILLRALQEPAIAGDNR
jgi:hypothetical protein